MSYIYVAYIRILVSKLQSVLHNQHYVTSGFPWPYTGCNIMFCIRPEKTMRLGEVFFNGFGTFTRVELSQELRPA